MAAATILKNGKMQYLKSLFLTNFDDIWHSKTSPPSGLHQPIKFRNLKIKHVGGCHLEKSKNHDIPQRTDGFWQNLARCCTSPPSPDSGWLHFL